MQFTGLIECFLFCFDFRCGSVIVDFSMKFNQSVIASEVFTILKDAAKQDKFGDFKVDPSSIKQTSPSPTDTAGTKGTVFCL